MEKFLELLLGSHDLPTYAAYFVFAAIGAVISLRIKAMQRDKHSEATPYKFSWRFLIQDNLMRLITGFLLAFITFRFTAPSSDIDALLLSAMGMGIGASTDRLAGLLEKIQNKARDGG